MDSSHPDTIEQLETEYEELLDLKAALEKDYENLKLQHKKEIEQIHERIACNLSKAINLNPGNFDYESVGYHALALLKQKAKHHLCRQDDLLTVLMCQCYCYFRQLEDIGADDLGSWDHETDKMIEAAGSIGE